jgi:hypothetical protein
MCEILQVDMSRMRNQIDQIVEGECEQTYPGAIDPFPQGAGASPKIRMGPTSEDLVDLGVDLHVAQLHREGAVETTWLGYIHMVVAR